MSCFEAVLRIRIRMFWGLPDQDPLVRGKDPASDPVVRGTDPGPSIIKQQK